METGGYILGDSNFIADFKKAIMDKRKRGARMKKLPCIECINCTLWHKDRWQQRHNWLYRLLWRAKQLFCRRPESETLKLYAKKFPKERK